MIEVAEGAAPTADDMEILEMVLDSMRNALSYSADTTQKVRADFRKINADLVSFGNTLKEMIAAVSQSLITTHA